MFLNFLMVYFFIPNVNCKLANMKKLSCLLFFFSMAVCGQKDMRIGVRLDTIQIKADSFIGHDIFGSYYFIQDNILIKKDRPKTWQYKNPALGKISKADLQNPLKLVLFYQNFNTVVLLDNQLNETQKINLSQNTVPIVATAVGLAFGNRLWIYNSLTQQIGLFDYLKNDYQKITAPFKGNIKYYDSDFNYFQWIDDQLDWYRCDIYGKITLVGKIPEFDQLQMVSDTTLIYRKDNELYSFAVSGNKSTLIDFGEKTFESFYYKEQILSIFTRQGITNYKITLP
jgi:hypothetical protein